jgi:type IX secretion system PorP/SprF family membrane protein
MRKLKIIFLLFCSAALKAQQDPQYSQYMFNQVIINPAYIGSREALNITGLFRKEWVNVSGSPQTNNLAVSAPLQSKKMGAGGHITQESIGPKKWISAYGDYSYRIRLPEGKLSFGLSAGLVAYQFNTSLLDLYDKDEPAVYNNLGSPSIRFDMNTGAYYYTRTFYVGFSATHLTSPKLLNADVSGSRVNFYNLNRHFFLTIGKGFAVSDQLVINPSVMLKMVDRELMVDFNTNMQIKNRIWLGISLRSSLNLVSLAQYKVNDKLKIGYSYDYGLRGISRASYGSHELMLSYDLGSGKSKMVTSRFL